jgi:hypothetical protein
MRNIYFLLCFFLTAGTIGFFSPLFDINLTSSTAGGSTYGVEIAKFKYPVYTDYFEEVDDVVELSGKDGEYHYLAGLTNSKSSAENLAEEIKSFGYANAEVIDLNSEFSSEQIAAALSTENADQDITKKEKITSQTIQKKQAVEMAIGKLTNIGNAYYYTILLQKSKEILNAESFSPHNSVKVLETNGKFQYVLGRFEDVGDAKKYLEEKVLVDFPHAIVAVINKGELAEVREATEVQKENSKVEIASNKDGSYNMGRKMRGKEYVDYYYELGSLKISEKPHYVIEIGDYNDKALADEAVQKLKDLGFTQARVRTPSTSKLASTNASLSVDGHFTIQVFASKSEMNVKRLTIKNLTRAFDQEDELYRYFHGDFDNYWVCRRELREIRQQGYDDAFIVKL